MAENLLNHSQAAQSTGQASALLTTVSQIAQCHAAFPPFVAEIPHALVSGSSPISGGGSVPRSLEQAWMHEAPYPLCVNHCL